MRLATSDTYHGKQHNHIELFYRILRQLRLIVRLLERQGDPEGIKTISRAIRTQAKETAAAVKRNTPGGASRAKQPKRRFTSGTDSR